MRRFWYFFLSFIKRRRIATCTQTILVSFLVQQALSFALCILQSEKLFPLVMENRFNSRKNENAFAVPPTLLKKNTMGSVRQKGLLMKTI